MSDSPDPEIRLNLHADLKALVLRIGQDKTPVLMIDNFLAQPETLAEIAATRTFAAPDKPVMYPGVRALAPEAYVQAFRTFLPKAMCDTFGLTSADVVSCRSIYSLVTVPPEHSAVRQRIPHYDGIEANMFASMYYLCGKEMGGTSFYRHRRTGFEHITSARAQSFSAALQDELEASAPPSGYINGDTALFQQTASFDARFNRLVIYRATMLHAGDIAADFRFDPNPRTGRLSINSFFLIR